MEKPGSKTIKLSKKRPLGRNKKMYAYLPTQMSNGEIIWLQEYFESKYADSVYRKKIKS